MESKPSPGVITSFDMMEVKLSAAMILTTHSRPRKKCPWTFIFHSSRYWLGFLQCWRIPWQRTEKVLFLRMITYYRLILHTLYSHTVLDPCAHHLFFTQISFFTNIMWSCLGITTCNAAFIVRMSYWWHYMDALSNVEETLESVLLEHDRTLRNSEGCLTL